MSDPARLREFRDFAMVCEGRARGFVDIFRSHSPRDSERKAEERLARAERAFDVMQEAMERWNAEGTVEYVEAIKFSRGRQLESITVGNATFATAHEAAYGLAEAVRTVWVTAGGDGPVEECERLQSGLEAVAMPANLYGLIEVEYHAVLNGTEEGANSEHGQPDAPLSVSLDPPQVTIDGHPYGLSDTQAAFVQQLLDAGDWVSGKDIDLGTRAGRIRKSLPGPVADIVESRDGVGFRVRPEYLA